MKVTAAISAVALGASGASAAYANMTTTEYDVVTAFTTYCPEPTTIVTNNRTIVVTAPTTLTITDCPCTIPKQSTANNGTYSTTTRRTTSSIPGVSSHPANGAAAIGAPALAGVIGAAAVYLL